MPTIDPFNVKAARISRAGQPTVPVKEQKDPGKVAAMSKKILGTWQAARQQAANTSGLANTGGGGRPSGGGAPVSTLAGLPQTPELQKLIEMGLIKEGMPQEQALAILSIQGLIGQLPIDIDALQKQIAANYANTGNVTTDAAAWMKQMMGANAPDMSDPAMAALYAADPMFTQYANNMAQIDETAQQNQATDQSWFDKQQQAMTDYYNSLMQGMAAGTIATGGSGGGGGGGGGRGRGGGGYGGGGGGGSDTNVKLVEQQQIRDAAQQTNQELYPGWEDALRALHPDDPAYQQLFHQMHAESGGVPWKFERLANQQLQENFAQEAADDLTNLSNNAWLSGLPGNTQNALDEYMSLNGLIQDYDPTTGATQLVHDPNESDEARTLRMERQSLMTEEEKVANDQRAALVTAANNPALMPPEVLQRLALKQQVFTPPTGTGGLADLIAEHERFIPGAPTADNGTGTGTGTGLDPVPADSPFPLPVVNPPVPSSNPSRPATNPFANTYVPSVVTGSSMPTANGVPTYPGVLPGQHPDTLDTVPLGGPAVYPTDLNSGNGPSVDDILSQFNGRRPAPVQASGQVPTVMDQIPGVGQGVPSSRPQPNLNQILKILGQGRPLEDEFAGGNFGQPRGMPPTGGPGYNQMAHPGDDQRVDQAASQGLPGVNFEGGGAGNLVQRTPIDYQSVTDALLGRKPVPEEGFPIDEGQPESTPASRAANNQAATSAGNDWESIIREGIANREEQLSPLARRLDFGGAPGIGSPRRGVMANLRANAIARFYNASDEEREAIANSPNATWGTNLVEANSLAQDEEGNWQNTGPTVRADMVPTLKMQSEEALAAERGASQLDEETFNRYLPKGRFWNSQVLSPEDRAEIAQENPWINEMWNTSYNLNPNTGMNPTRNQLQSTGTETATATQTLYPEDEVALPITGGVTDPDSGVTWDALFNKGVTNPVRLGDEAGGEPLSLSDPDEPEFNFGPEGFTGAYSTDFVRNLINQSAEQQATQAAVRQLAKGRTNAANKSKSSFSTKPSTAASRLRLDKLQSTIAALPRKTDGARKKPRSGGKRQQAV